MDDNFEHRLVIHDISHTPGRMFNLFSTGIMIKRGWILFGNKDILWLQKGDKRIKFIIKVKTEKGTLYCMRVTCNDGPTRHMTWNRMKEEEKK